MRTRIRSVLVGAAVTFLLWLTWNRHSITPGRFTLYESGWKDLLVDDAPGHPLDRLLDRAKRLHRERVQEAERQRDLGYAIQEYIHRYGMNPPAGFDEWHAFMLAHEGEQPSYLNFDSMMESFLPFRGVEPAQLRQLQLRTVESGRDLFLINIVNGEMELRDSEKEPYSGGYWALDGIAGVFRDLAPMLPDVQIVVNTLDEPRVSVPFENANAFIQSYQSGGFHKMVIPLKANGTGDLLFSSNGSAYEFVRDSCPPDSPARQFPLSPHPGSSQVVGRAFTKGYATERGGFIVDARAAADLCTQPDMQDLAGILIQPTTQSITRHLTPIFSQCRVKGFHDLLLPSHYHWDPPKSYASSEQLSFAWSEKVPKLFWRGSTTGGQAKGDNWLGMQRQRFISRTHRQHEEPTMETVLADARGEINATTGEGTVEITLPASHLDAALVDAHFAGLISCEPEACEAMHASKLLRFGASSTFRDMAQHRFLLDVDGNSFSARFPGLLAMGSAVMKSQIFEEWFTGSMVAWYDYIPLDYRYHELYHILAYFRGLGGSEVKEGQAEGMDVEEAMEILQAPSTTSQQLEAQRILARHVRVHEEEGRAIGEQGRAFGEQLGKDAIQVYVYRMLLEWSRILGLSGDL